MSQNTEQTEAKLAAYIDGTLDPAERAEIEKYLAANPEHRKLIAELTAQRDVLRNLPRSKAPADVYDSIQAQLERAILLDDTGPAALPISRRSRRPQLFAVAAMLLLSLGLGAVLYFALPSSQPHPTEVAINDHAREVTSSPTTAFYDTETNGDGVAVTGQNAPAPATPSIAGKSGAAPAAGPLAEGPVFAYRKEVASNSLPPNAVGESLTLNVESKVTGENLVAAEPAAPEQPVVLLVSTNNPDQARQQVAMFLESNKLNFKPATPLTETHYSAVLADADKAKDAPPAAATASPVQSNELGDAKKPATDADRLSASRNLAKKESSATSEEKTENFSRRAPDGARLKTTEAETTGTLDVSGGRGAGGGAQSGPGLQQQAQEQQQQRETPNLTQSAQATTSAPPQQQRLDDLSQQQLVRGLGQTPTTTPYNGRVIARSVMTRRQAYELANTLSNDRPGQVARLLDEQPVVNYATNRARSVAPQQTPAYVFTTTAPSQVELKNYGVLSKQLTDLGSQSATSAEAGQRTEAAAPALSQNFDSLGVITVAPGAESAPTTQDSQTFANGSLTISNSTVAGTPATEPAIAPLADDAVDVLIMVQDEAATPVPSKIAPYPAKARATNPGD